MTRLDENRKKIDEIDKQIAELFEQRFEVVKDVIAYKIENDLPIFQSGREDVIRQKNVGYIQDEQMKPYYQAWFDRLLELSKEFQQEILDKSK